MTKTELLDRCVRSGEERVLLSRVLDKLELSQNRGIPAHTPFLSPGERASVTDLLSAWGHPRHVFFGGYPDAERTVCLFLPDWQEEEDAIADPEGPLAALEATFPNGAELSHRDILGSLMGLGITREKLGDILVEGNRCQVLALRDALPILLSQWESAGRWKAKLREISLSELTPKPPRVFYLPLHGRSAGERRAGIGEPPGVYEKRPHRRAGGRALLPGAGQVRGQRSAGPVQKGPDHADFRAIYIRQHRTNAPAMLCGNFAPGFCCDFLQYIQYCRKIAPHPDKKFARKSFLSNCAVSP